MRQPKRGPPRETFTRIGYSNDSGNLDVEIFDVPGDAGADWDPRRCHHGSGLVGHLHANVTYGASPLRIIVLSTAAALLDPYPAADGGRGLPEAVRSLEAAETVAAGVVEVEIQEVIAQTRRDGAGGALLSELERFARGIRQASTDARPFVAIEGEPVPTEDLDGGRAGLVKFYENSGYERDGKLVRRFIDRGR